MKTGAVVVTDIVGYSKLTGDNQELALELLTEHDSIILKSIFLMSSQITFGPYLVLGCILYLSLLEQIILYLN